MAKLRGNINDGKIICKQGDISIYDVYTWHDGETSQLMREIGYRNGTCILCEDGIIENVVSGSYNEYSVKYQRLPKERVGNAIVFQLSFCDDRKIK